MRSWRAGQQFVAYGVHPGTGQPYAWPDDDLLDLERDDLPELTADLAARIIAAAESDARPHRLCGRHGTELG